MGFIINGVKKLIKTIIKLSLYLALIAVIIIVIPNLPPYTKFSTIEISPIQPRVGPLALNGVLNNAQKSYNGKLLGPEAFQIYKGELYTSLSTGEIVKLSPGGHVTFVTSVGQPCSGIMREHICGRPLGFVINEKDESLYVADAYLGIWKVNLKTDKKQLLVSPRTEIEKRKPRIFNCVALAKNGDLYWTDSSSDFDLKDGVLTFMSDPSGRLFQYDAAKNQSKVLIDDLWFANGVVVSPNNDFVVVSESSRGRLMKYYISGPKKGQTTIFIDGLPGVPDNLRALPDGSGLLVALYTVFEEDRPPLPSLLAATPLIRKLVARLHRLVEIPFEYLNTIYPHIVFEEIVYTIGHFKSISGLTPALSGLLQVDWDGNVVAGYYNTDRTLGHVSDAIVFNDKLYTGSPHLQNFVGTVPVPPLLKKAFESSVKSKAEEKVQKTKPVQEVPTKKTEEKPKAKIEEKPKLDIKPKVEEKPKPAPKPVEKKATIEKEAPKVAKPVVPEPKPSQQAKPATIEKEAPKVVKPVVTEPKQAQQAKPTAQPPADKKPSEKAKAPQQAPPNPSPPKPTPTPAKPEPAKASTKTEPQTTTAKPEVKTTPPPKPAEKTTPPPPKSTPKPTETKNEAPKKAQPAPKQDTPKAPELKPKPIREEIPSDTAKPTKETLKVIKRDGPAEIHVPNQ